MTAGNKHKGKINVKYTCCKTRTKHLALSNPTLTKNDKDRRIEWLVFKHTNMLTAAVKDELIKLGVVKDQPEITSECFPIFVSNYLSVILINCC